MFRVNLKDMEGCRQTASSITRKCSGSRREESHSPHSQSVWFGVTRRNVLMETLWPKSLFGHIKNAVDHSVGSVGLSGMGTICDVQVGWRKHCFLSFLFLLLVLESQEAVT